jgi:hypothetical protein
VQITSAAAESVLREILKPKAVIKEDRKQGIRALLNDFICPKDDWRSVFMDYFL